MTDTDALVDENGIEVRSLAKKIIEPKPDPEDLTRVRTGEGPADYEYVDPCSLFKLERAMADLRRERPKNNSQRYKLLKDYGKFVRELTERCEAHWPAAGYLVPVGMRIAGELEFLPDEPDPEPASDRVTDIPGALILDAKGRWVPVCPDEDDVDEDELLPGARAVPAS